MSDSLSDLSIYFTFLLFITFSFQHFLLLFTFLFLMSWTETPRTSAEELGPPDYRNSSAGYEPNDHFITETYVEVTQESVTEQRFTEDLDHDDTVIGQTLFNAYRRRVDHSEGEGLSSGLSSSSMSHDRTGQPVVNSEEITSQVTKFRAANEELGILAENNTLTLLRCLIFPRYLIQERTDYSKLTIL